MTTTHTLAHCPYVRPRRNHVAGRHRCDVSFRSIGLLHDHFAGVSSHLVVELCHHNIICTSAHPGHVALGWYTVIFLYGIFLPCDHGVDFDIIISLLLLCEESINKTIKANIYSVLSTIPRWLHDVRVPYKQTDVTTATSIITNTVL